MNEYHATGLQAFRFRPQISLAADVPLWHKVKEATRHESHIEVSAPCGVEADSRLVGELTLHNEVLDLSSHLAAPFADGDRCPVCWPARA